MAAVAENKHSIEHSLLPSQEPPQLPQWWPPPQWTLGCLWAYRDLLSTTLKSGHPTWLSHTVTLKLTFQYVHDSTLPFYYNWQNLSQFISSTLAPHNLYTSIRLKTARHRLTLFTKSCSIQLDLKNKTYLNLFWNQVGNS